MTEIAVSPKILQTDSKVNMEIMTKSVSQDTDATCG
jgi:hypothetical protein